MITWALWILFGSLLTLALLSPLESLRWWARDGQSVASLVHKAAPEELDAARSDADADPVQQFVVYLSGVAVASGGANSTSKTEMHFLDALSDRIPSARITGDVFPYSPQNLGLPQRRLSGWLWSFAIRHRRRSRFSLLSYLIKIRNILQIMVAGDPRYGPTYGLGLANEITRSLLDKGYRLGSGTTVTVIGFSGGAQMCLNAAWFLESSGIPTQIVSMGGIFANNPAFERLHRFIHLWGSKDLLHHLGPVFSPRRLRWFPSSAFNRAKAEGRVLDRCIGPMRHDAAQWYLDHRATTPDGHSYFDITTDAIVEFLHETPLPTTRPRDGRTS